MRFHLASLCAAGLLVLGATSALAATATGTFNSLLTITAQCKVQSASNMNFGSTGVIDSTITSTSTIGVQCTNGEGYTISLDGGSGSSGTTTTRTMENGSEYVNYTLWQNSAHTQNWGNTGSEIMTSLTGNGSVQSYTVYGQILAQSTPTAGSYSDTVTVTVTYP
jgi:spore coat protein U-like protein